MVAKKKPKKKVDLETKVNLIFRYTQDMHHQLFSILLMLGIVFALVLINTYTLYDSLITGRAVLDSEVSLFSPFSDFGLAIVFLIFAMLLMMLAIFKKGKFEKIIHRI